MRHNTFQLISRKNKNHIGRNFICTGCCDLSKNNGSEEKQGKLEETTSFEGQFAGSKHWFDHDIQWVEENFSTREPQFYKRLFLSNIEGQAVSKYSIFPVTIGNVKKRVKLNTILKIHWWNTIKMLHVVVA